MLGLRKNIGWSGAEILRASEAELFSATPQTFPGRMTGVANDVRGRDALIRRISGWPFRAERVRRSSPPPSSDQVEHRTVSQDLPARCAASRRSIR